MSIIKRWHCSKCHHEWDSYCPICDWCAEVGWEMPKLKADEYVFTENIDELLDQIEQEGEEDAEL